MTTPRERPPGADLDERFAVSEREVERRKALRDARLNRFQIPALRLGGMTLLALGVLLNDLFVLRNFSLGAWLEVLGGLEAYALLSWAVLHRFWRSGARVDLGVVFLVADLPMWTWAIYRSGAERSALAFLLLMRVADQSMTTFRRVVWFAHATAVSYAGMLLYVELVAGRPLDWPAVGARLAFLYIAAIYISFSARTAEQRRQMTAAAIRMARDLIPRLEAMRERAEQASRAKTELLANMSHEVRTPLNAIIGFAQLLLKRTHGEMNARQFQHVTSILSSGRRLLRLLTDVLDLAELEAGRMKLALAEVDVARELRAAVDTARSSARAQGLSVTLAVGEPLPALTADPTRFRQILDQLVGNAVKFTPPGGRVTVSADLAEEPATDGRGVTAVVRVRVADTGLGINPRDQARVFEAFEQVDASRARRVSGAGVGLALTRKLVEAHRGRILLESAGVPGQGSVFTVVLPLRGAASRPG